MQETAGTGYLASQGALERKLPHSPVDRETVQDRVYRRIREMILNGEIEPGQTVTIPGLSAAFQVSAMPVREALRRLMAEQALMVVSGRSVGIPALTRARLADLRRVRREVEGLAIAWAAERIGADELRRLADMVHAMQRAADERDGRRYVPANHDFHFTIYRAAESPTLLSIIESLWLQIGPYFHVLRASENWNAANSRHRAMVEALGRRDGKEATVALQRDIDEAAASLELLLS
ncbi:MAG TPA: GntR family transcriptional regulator [Acetobacteraceae bacterium]|nr:GntR family transcriptional regulator [Acetobacteraceae bacterium]